MARGATLFGTDRFWWQQSLLIDPASQSLATSDSARYKYEIHSNYSIFCRNVHLFNLYLFYRRKKKDSHLNGVKHGILLAPILFIWAFQIISPVFYVPAFPDNYEMIRSTISFAGFILFLLYLVIVEVLINNGKLSWFLRKKE